MSDKHLPIGIFDSGMGGLTCVKALRELLPQESFIFLGDTARLPYGTRDAETIRRFAQEDMDFLLGQQVKFLVAACGTVSSNIAAEQIDALPVPFLGILSPAAAAAKENTKNNIIGVLGTQATVQSGAFPRLLAQMDEHLQVHSVACPLFVPLVENGQTQRDNPLTLAAAEEYLRPLMDAHCDTIILGCTHFPILKDLLQDIVGPSVTLIDSGAVTAAAVAQQLAQLGLLNDQPSGTHTYYVTKKGERFSSLATLFLGEDISQHVKDIDL